MQLAQNQLLKFYNSTDVTRYKKVDLCLPVIVVYAEIKSCPFTSTGNKYVREQSAQIVIIKIWGPLCGSIITETAL